MLPAGWVERLPVGAAVGRLRSWLGPTVLHDLDTRFSHGLLTIRIPKRTGNRTPASP